MKWIRGPWWDSCWFLSAPALALLMLAPYALGKSAREWVMFGLMSFGLAHTFSPIVLAWSHKGYRAVMQRNRDKFVLGPILVMGLGLLAPLATAALFPDFRRHGSEMLEELRFEDMWVPFIVWSNLYAAWNLYHGGAQNFGLLCLYRGRGFKGRTKLLILFLCVAATIFGAHFVPRLAQTQVVFLLCFGALTGNHYSVAIGLSAHVWANHHKRSPWWFVAIVLVLGTLVTWAIHEAFLVTGFVAMLALSLRAALGIWHFLQDRWVWQLSKPEVRSTIGRDLVPAYSDSLTPKYLGFTSFSR